MQFSPDLAQAIVDLWKWRTTRLQVGEWCDETDPELGGDRVQWWRLTKPCAYTVGHDFAVCPGRGKRQIARRVPRLITGYLGGIEEAGCVHDTELATEAERKERYAEREGFRTWYALMAKWDHLYGEHPRKYNPVWVIDFELVKESASGG